MCGIAGVVTWDQRHRIDRATLKRMSNCIAHRGPDGSGETLSHDQIITSARPQCGLAHRRLAVIDLDPRSNQPFQDPPSRHWIVFNGEIYNYKALRKEISVILPRHAWRTESDTEVLLASYLAWGEKCVEKLIGQFAFAIWDDAGGTLFLARDRMGQKPLYYVADGGGEASGDEDRPPMAIGFASELSALRQLKWMDSSINQSALTDYLRYGYVPSPATIYNGAWKLPPGTWLKINADAVRSERYFDPNASSTVHPPAAARKENGNDTAPIKRTRELVAQAVTRRLVADVPLGCFLSGGIDSSIIVAAMKSSLPKNQPLLTFSIGFDDPLYDETKFAAEVAAHLGTTHRQFTVQPNAADDLPKLARVYGEPFGDSSALPTHYLSRETRQHVKVALSGDGGDELFGGYDRYRAMAISQRLHDLPAPLRWLAGTSLWQLVPGTHPKSKVSRAKRLVSAVRYPPGKRYENYMRLFDDAMIRALVPGARRAESTLDLSSLFDEQMADADAVRAALRVDRLTYLPDDLLTKLDRASMLHALEVRSPFMDHDLVRFAAGLSTSQLLDGGGKRMLRNAFAADLPSPVFSRPKMGFAVPIGDWLRTSLAEMLHGLLFAEDSFASANLNLKFIRKLVDDHQANRSDHSQRLYALLMLELWWRWEKEA